MSLVCRSVNVDPSVTMYCSVATLVLSMVGSYVSDSTPSATVYQTFDPVSAAVPRQSLRPRSKYDIAPGAPGATPAAGPAKRAAAEAPVPVSGTVAAAARTIVRNGRTRRQENARARPAADRAIVHLPCESCASRRPINPAISVQIPQKPLPASACCQEPARQPAGAAARVSPGSQPASAV